VVLFPRARLSLVVFFLHPIGEEEPDGDPRPGAGGERHARQVHHPPAQEGQQLQAHGRRGGLSI